MNCANTDNSLHKLADYPVLATLAQGRTTATNLDGRACRFIYIEAMSLIDTTQISDKEKAFMGALGVDCPAIKQDIPC